ncbi:MAG: protein kinase [Lachnospiraceae bacterium]|nr:protein kinase [Lachnospiraceae bacterium]
MPYPGEVIAGTYQIIDEIGAGGAGIIYRAWHLNLQKYVVVKKVRDHVAGVLNVRREADILKSMHHTCLPQVYDFIQLGSGIYTVMDFIDGHDLQYYIRQRCTFEESSLWHWLTQLLEVLSYLHSRRILHLDIKPANIMLMPDGNPCLIDFNISLSGEGANLQGISQNYASPEQYQKWMGTLYHTEDQYLILDAQTDIYSLGGVFYQLMTGYLPSPEPQKMYPLSSFSLSYSDALVQIVSKMMREDKRRRYVSAERTLSAIRRLQRTRAEKRTLRTVILLMAAGIAVICVAAGIAVYRDRGHVTGADIASITEEEELLSALNLEGEYEEAYGEGVRYLNENGSLLDRVEGARQSILEQVLDACMGREDYASAMDYVQDLLEIEVLADYEQTAAVIYAYSGDYEQAEMYLEAAEADGADERDLEKSRAEMAVSQGDYASAVAIYGSLYAEKQETAVLRRLAYLSLTAGLEESDVLEANAFLANAAAWYELLCQDDMGTFTDQMNLAEAYTELGSAEKAAALLKSMCAKYPDRYEPYLNLAILEYNMQMKKALTERDFTSVIQYTKKAEALYESAGSSDEDEQMEQMIRIAEELS